MRSLILDDRMLEGFLIVALAAALVAVWVYKRSHHSKATFALAIVSALSATSAACLKFLQGGWAHSALGSLVKTGQEFLGINFIADDSVVIGPISFVLGAGVSGATLIFIYKIGKQVIANWPREPTLLVNELAKDNVDNDMFRLAVAEFVRIASRRRDPVASESAVRWQQQFVEAPGSPPWHISVRHLLEAAISEAEIPEDGWRDRYKAWVGTISEFGTIQAHKIPLLAFLFDTPPSDEDIRNQVSAALGELVNHKKIILYAIFNAYVPVSERICKIDNIDITVLSDLQLLRNGLRLNNYANDLRRRFELDTVAATSATLVDTYVECHVRSLRSSKRVPLSDVLENWLPENGRRHLAITGEYGRGKSTAMLQYSAGWAKRFLNDGAKAERIPLLIELRGQNPAENSPLAFLSIWASRYGINPMLLMSLVELGQAIVIFEGFDELRNAGRAYDRHAHFNALWAFAYPRTKLIFTGRPNFFIDEIEKNRTLRAGQGEVHAFTQVWEVAELTEQEIITVADVFRPDFGHQVIALATEQPNFLDIISRASMLPLLASVWDEIESFQRQGVTLTNGLLIDKYIAVSYERKEKELEEDRRYPRRDGYSKYMLLPTEVKDFVTVLIVNKMVRLDLRNTITRKLFDDVIRDNWDEIFRICCTKGVAEDIVRKMIDFETRYKDETRADRLAIISNEIASSGIFVSDPAGGPSNLKMPHKQFYEYLIAKGGYWGSYFPVSQCAGLLNRNSDALGLLTTEKQAIIHLDDIIGNDFSGLMLLLID